MNNNKVSLACEECKRKNYVKNKSGGNPTRLVVRKFCPNCKKQTNHKEEV
ncbi:50S ribosomal protein L33 [Mycoplasmopsis gallopavonis]|nr:50S ribosomal protein L33 [Mycoplasmopsis gallopavonis]RIV16956.1 50S ribosomal protein L33 [Mycoplasmopsis gallopavonis]